MKRTILAAALAAFVLGGGAATVLSQGEPPPLKVGFLDVGKAFEDYRKREQVEGTLNARTDALEEKFRGLKAELEAAVEELRTLNPDSEAYTEKRRQIELQQMAVKYDREQALKGLEREARRQKALLYKEICEEAGAWGEEHGLAAVFLKVPLGQEFIERGDLDLITSTRTALWSDSRLDITADLVQHLNASLEPK